MGGGSWKENFLEEVASKLSSAMKCRGYAGDKGGRKGAFQERTSEKRCMGDKKWGAVRTSRKFRIDGTWQGGQKPENREG